jgi:hypothetical protein
MEKDSGGRRSLVAVTSQYSGWFICVCGLSHGKFNSMTGAYGMQVISAHLAFTYSLHVQMVAQFDV